MSVRARIHARSSLSFSEVRALSVGMEPRMPASAQATIISLLEMRNMGAATSGYLRPSDLESGVSSMAGSYFGAGLGEAFHSPPVEKDCQPHLSHRSSDSAIHRLQASIAPR